MPTPAEQAAALGYEYLGFGGWGNPDDRVVKAKTVDGKLVKVEDDQDEKDDTDLGRLIVVDLDPSLIHGTNKVAVQKYATLIKSLLDAGSDFYVLTARTTEEDTAKFLHSIGITKGLKLAPYGSAEPEKKRDFIEQKIKEGYTEIQYFDRDSKSVAAVESLKAPYNKLEIRIDGHIIPAFVNKMAA